MHDTGMQASYSKDEIQQWFEWTPEQRLLEAEKLWEEFLIKYPVPQKPFFKIFDSFEDYDKWLKASHDPLLW